MLPSLCHMAHISAPANQSTSASTLTGLPPEILSYILTFVGDSESDVASLRDTIVALCTIHKCPEHLWQLVFEELQLRAGRGDLEVKFKIPADTTAETYLRHIYSLHKIISTKDWTYDSMEFGAVSLLRKLHDYRGVRLNPLVPKLIEKWNATLEAKQYPMALDNNEGETPEDPNYLEPYNQLCRHTPVKRLPWKKGSRDGMFYGMVTPSEEDWTEEEKSKFPGFPIQGWWTDDEKTEEEKEDGSTILWSMKCKCISRKAKFGDFQLSAEGDVEVFYTAETWSTISIETITTSEYTRLYNWLTLICKIDWSTESTKEEREYELKEEIGENASKVLALLNGMRFSHTDLTFGDEFLETIGRDMDSHERHDHLDAFMQFRAMDHELMLLYTVLDHINPSDKARRVLYPTPESSAMDTL